jgi:hypothetical protein
VQTLVRGALFRSTTVTVLASSLIDAARTRTMAWMNTVKASSSLVRVVGRVGFAVLAAALSFPWMAARSSSLGASGSADTQDMLPLQFAQEYVRELGEQESLRVRTDLPDHGPDEAAFGSIVKSAAAMRFALSDEVRLLNSTHLVSSAAFGHQLDSLPILLARLYRQKMRLLGSMSDIAGAVIVGPGNGEDYASAAAETAKLAAALESADKGLVQASDLVFAALLGPGRDRHGMSRLSITCPEWGMLRGELHTDFGATLNAKHKTNLEAAAAQLDTLLSRNVECAGRSERPQNRHD